MPLFDYLLDENKAQGIQPGNFSAGVNNVDNGQVNEKSVLLPALTDPESTWLDYRCSLECRLDSGIVVHRQLPQTAYTADSLGSMDVARPDLMVKDTTHGIDFRSHGNWTDTVQRMANSRYRFRLYGFAIRASYKVPIPMLESVCGVPAIPDDRIEQFAANDLIANVAGTPLFWGRWDLWYTVAVPPRMAQLSPANLAEHIRADQQLSKGIQIPISGPDYNARPAAPAKLDQVKVQNKNALLQGP